MFKLTVYMFKVNEKKQVMQHFDKAAKLLAKKQMNSCHVAKMFEGKYMISF